MNSEIVAQKHSSTDFYEGYEMTDYDHYVCAIDAPEHSRRNTTIRFDESDLVAICATELARLLTVGHILAHGLNTIRTVDTPLESDIFLVLGENAFHRIIKGDIRNAESLKSLLLYHNDTTDDGHSIPE